MKMLLRKNDSVFDKINNYLTKKGHELVLSLYLANYSGSNIYVRFDYVPKIKVYKVVWVDLDFFDEKKIDLFINQQMVTKYCALKIVEKMSTLTIEPGFRIDEDIIGDRVEILSYLIDDNKEFVFNRFLPLEWKELIEPLVLLFSYLPRGMDVFLNEMFGLFDGKKDFYNLRKAIKFDLLKGDLSKLFKEQELTRAKKYEEGERVSFLEKIDNVYIGIVDGFVPYLVVVEELENGYIGLKSSCKCNNYCKHIAAVIYAIRNKRFNSFYKVRYVGSDDTTLLDKVTNATFNLCFGIDGEKLLLVTAGLEIYKTNLFKDGKCLFEVIEDDDECNLSKSIKDLEKK